MRAAAGPAASGVIQALGADHFRAGNRGAVLAAESAGRAGPNNRPKAPARGGLGLWAAKRAVQGIFQCGQGCY